MTTLIIIVLIVLGVLLLLLEFLVFPGITIAGIGGGLLIGGGILISYVHYGSQVGHITLVVALLFCGGVLLFALKSRTWNKLMLDTQVKGKVESFKDDSIHEGDSGIAITRLAPMGKVMINDITMEAKSNGPLIDVNTPIEVVKVMKKSIIVKSKNTK